MSSTSNTSGEPMIKLQAGDDTVVEVRRAVAMKCKSIKNTIVDLGDCFEAVPLPNVTGPVLIKVFEYLNYYHDHPLAGEEDDVDDDNNNSSNGGGGAAASSSSGATAMQEDGAASTAYQPPKKKKKVRDLNEFDTQYFASTAENSHAGVWPILLAANYLENTKLLEIAAKHVALLIKKNKDELQKQKQEQGEKDIRAIFNLPQAFTEEQQKVLRERIEKMAEESETSATTTTAPTDTTETAASSTAAANTDSD